MHRLAVSAKRKVLLNPRTVTVYVFAIFFTFLLAYHHRLNLDQNGPSINSLRIIQLRDSWNSDKLNFSSLDPSGKSKINQKSRKSGKCQAPPLEVKTDFNTFDLFEKTVGNGQVVAANAQKNRKKEKLKVFVLPFTHVDPGWLETFESYTKRTNQILDNMHNFMMKNEKMRFMWAEFVFFERWWSLQTDQVKNDVRKLVTSGRLELATGSWVMTDEANPYFPVSVDNIVEGFQFIDQNFGIKPRTIWSNDPFGYSNTVPYFFRKAGVHRHVINRIHHKLKNVLQSHKAIPFEWRQYFDATGENDVLTQVLPYTHYDILNSCGSDSATCCEFDFKRMTHWSCPGPKPTNTTKENVKNKAEKLINSLEKMAEMYKAPVVLMMHGDDFRFDMIEEWHQHHDNFLPIFDEINKGDRVEIRFGTFTDYFDNLESWYSENKELAPPTLSGDFFPYMCALGDYWTGYFTTRPFFKRQGRLLHSLIRSADVIFSMARSSLKQRKIDENQEKLEKARRNLALFQHHDAITGTSKVSVMDNYSELLHSSIIAVKEVLEVLGKGELDQYPRVHDGVEIKAIIDFDKSTSDKVIKIFNSLLFKTTDVFQIRTNHQDVKLSIDGKVIEAQVEPYFIKNKTDPESFLVLFRASIPPLSVLKVQIAKGDSNGMTKVVKLEAKTPKSWDIGGSWTIETSTSTILSLESPFLTSTHSLETGALQKVTKTSSKSTFTLQQTWQKYRDAAGGAYLMKLHTNPMEMTNFQWLKMSGPIRQSIIQMSDTVFQKTSVKNVEGPSGEELDISLSIDITSYRNTELMTQYSTGWDHPTTYTDSVGMQLLRREFYRLPVQENYYPMPTAAVIENSNERISIVSNVEHGARFMEKGTVEINIDRMLNQDDGKGLGYGDDSIPIDLKPVDMKFKLIFESLDDQKQVSHYSTHTLHGQQAVQRVIYPPISLISRVEIMDDVEEIDKDSGLEFPCDVQLLTIRPLSDNRQLAIFYRHASACVQRDWNGANCGEELKTSLFNLLLKLGVKRVQKTDLSGVTPIGDAQKVENLSEIDLNTFDFLTFVLYHS